MKFNRFARFGFILSVFFSGLGCAHIHEAAKEVWGSSMAHLEKARSFGRSTEIAMSVDEAFKRADEILVYREAIVYLKDKDMKSLAAMNFKGHVDTTQIGVFFTRIDDGRTKVEVASMSPRLVEEAAGFLFSGLGDDLEKDKGKTT